MSDTKVFIMTHKAFTPPQMDGFVPLQVGRALNPDLGYLSDMGGDHISDLNPYFGELTGFYYLWRNYTEVDNIGTCHYRRYFIEDGGRISKPKDLGAILNSGYDVISTNRITIDKPSYRDHYGAAHNVKDYDAMGSVIQELYPDYYEAFLEVSKGRDAYFGNILMMKKPLFDEYCQWLFTIFMTLGDRIDISSYDAYHARIYGFLSENMLMIFTKARGLKVYEHKVGLTAEKAETVEIKLAVAELVKQEKPAEALQLFNEFLKYRADITLPQSDIRGELPVIAQLLQLLIAEQKAGVKNGLYAKTHNLFEMIDLQTKDKS